MDNSFMVRFITWVQLNITLNLLFHLKCSVDYGMEICSRWVVQRLVFSAAFKRLD